MRLINTETLKLENFHESNLPKYAILSHTWGKSEITFRELRNLNMSLLNARIRIKGKAGYYKITKSCTQALSEGIPYVWVDTCCIDKRSSAELSEAINSMFRWYKNAAVCYAYLDDIDLFDPIRMGDKDLAKARWFTRGWTLQELIAPQNVVFYIKGWNCVGNKLSMKEKLSRITGIDEATLITRNLESVSVARRMSWASKRITTRVEDIAYSLLGIFDVNMPLLYGEGEKAFIRLQEEIMKDSEDQSLFAWNSPNAMEEEGRGVFAQHPSEFADSYAVKPSSSRGEPYTMTNKGVKMEIPILPLERGLFLVVLECNYDGDLSQQLSIVVQELHRGRVNQFVRHDAVGLIKVSREMVLNADIGTVYLCKNVPNVKDYSSVFKVFTSTSPIPIETSSICSNNSLENSSDSILVLRKCY
ncbi:HET-domain-containing protein [Zopfia rhizophila CBS 207.26]|uniref:HET-domain-containing protein n=1 Tax=Zopfia rhizophila CBS 207.26 TaxID=1314779 RepID=A0A6A6DIQ3_9PEZI|nr:HET-domain-containing protein [Zopfia rhizophila CBS 207.26]